MTIKWGPIHWGHARQSRMDIIVQNQRLSQQSAARLDVIDVLNARNASLTLDVDRLGKELAEANADIALQRKVVDRAREGRLRAEQQRNAAESECARLRQVAFDLRVRLSHSGQPRDEYGRYVAWPTHAPTDRGAEMPPAAGDHTTDEPAPGVCVDCGHLWVQHPLAGDTALGCYGNSATCPCTEIDTTTPADSRPTSERNTA